jgi:hypothetical protein
MPTRADSVLALQRAAGNRAVARLLHRCGPGGCSCGGACDEERLEDERDGKGWTPEQDLDDELEGHGRRSVLRQLDRPALQRLKITQYKFDKGDCGKRNVQWVFGLDSAAPEDGYIVQHIQTYSFVKDCPEQAIGPPGPEQEYWEAWFVKKGDKLDWTTVRDSWTDGSVLPVANHKNGSQMSAGTVKFFLKSKTGDLGDFGKAPADPKSDWGPGKVPRSGALPSTAKKPTWWDGPSTEGPADRLTTSQWDCCDPDSAKHTSNVTSKPTP